MRIAFVHPLYWPEVRRGSERVIHDLGSVLAEHGHEVTLYTTHPGPLSESVEDGMRIVRTRRPPPVPGLGLYELFLETVPAVIRTLVRGRHDVVHAFHLASAFGAVEARRLGGPPVVYSFHGIPTRRYLVARRRRIWMLRRVIAASAATTVLSEAAAHPLRRYLQHDPTILPAGVRMDAFRPSPARFPQPTLFCAASFTDPRKRVDLLLEAFSAMRRRLPEARLLLNDVPGAAQRPALPQGAEWIDLGGTGVLADAYAGAWATVLPSTEEAQGLVVLESLACGTPCVAARSGAPPEILAGARDVGALFDPDDRDGLAAAMEQALELPPRPGTVAACRARAEDYSWQALGDRHLDLYDSIR